MANKSQPGSKAINRSDISADRTSRRAATYDKKDFRLVYITVSMPFGPHESFFIPEVKELMRQGCEVRIIPRSPCGKLVNGDAAGLEEISIRRPLLFSAEILRSFLSELVQRPVPVLKALALLFQSRSFPVLMKNIAVFPKGIWVAKLARKWRADHIHSQWISTTATIALVASEITGIPWSCSAHRGDIADNNMLATKLSRARFIRFISESGIEIVRGFVTNWNRSRAKVIRMGIDIPPGTAEGREASGIVRILCPGNLNAVKGHKYLLEAMAILRDRTVPCFLDIAGDGPLRKKLATIARDLSIEHMVRFMGHLYHDDLLDLYRKRNVDIVVLPSVNLGRNEHEGVPVALIEAMGHCVPVVSTSTGGIPELLCDGSGIIVPPMDPVALADAMERLASDPGLRAEYARLGRNRVEKEFAIGLVVKDLKACMDREDDSMRFQ